MNKGLEALKNIKQRDRQVVVCLEDRQGIWGKFIAKGEELITIEKELKALEIIKNKKVDMMKLYYSELLIYYNEGGIYKELTQEEYDLLKEVLL